MTSNAFDTLTNRERVIYRTATGLVGFAITLVSASIAHFGRGDARELSVLYVIDPLVFFGLLMVSYYYFEKSHSFDMARSNVQADSRVTARSA